MKKSELKKMLQWLSFMLKCPVCSVQYNLSNIKIIDSEQDEAYLEARILIHSDCEKCKSSVMFNIDINGPEVFTVIAKTDLTSSDSDKFRSFQAIQIDECISLHKSLKKFNGDFVKAFKQPKSIKKRI